MPKAYVQWLVTPTSNREFLKSDIELDTGFLTEVCQGVFADTPENRDNGNLNHSNAALYRGLLFLLTRLSTGPMFYWVLLHFIKVIITMIVFLASAMVCYNSPTSGIIRNAGGALDRLLAVKHKKKTPYNSLYLTQSEARGGASGCCTAPQDERFRVRRILENFQVTYSFCPHSVALDPPNH